MNNDKSNFKKDKSIVKDNNRESALKLLLIIIDIILIGIILNIFGNLLASECKYFDFKIFTNYIPAVTTIVAIFVGYKQYIDNKTTENSKRLYEQELETVKLEEEIFYEYFNALTQLPLTMYKMNFIPLNSFYELCNQYIGIFAISDKMDIKTNIIDFKQKNACINCKYAESNYLNILSARKKIFELRNQILFEIKQEIESLQNQIVTCNNDILQLNSQFINLNIPQYMSNFSALFNVYYNESINQFYQKLYNANLQIQNNIGNIINKKVKQEFVQTYKIYNVLQKQYIEMKRQHNYKLNNKCEKCDYSKFTYADIEDNLRELQKIRNLDFNYKKSTKL